MRRVASLVVVVLATVGTARAEWRRVHSSQGEYLFAMSSVGPKEFFVAGMFMDPASRLPLPQPRVYWTQDGGALLKPILGNLPASFTSGIPAAIHFRDTMTGLLGMGNKVYRTVNRGAQWQGTDVGHGVGAVRFVGGDTAIAVGDDGLIARSDDGGQTWTPVESGTDADLGCLFFVGRDTGFAAGTRVVEEDDGQGGTTTRYEEAVVLLTSDGGRTWRKGFTTSGLGLCPLFFLKDGRRGWLAAMEPDPQPGGRRSKAILLATTDGGLTFEDTGLDVRVGTLQFLMAIPLTASYFVAMHWDDEFRGHLAGAAYLISLSSGMGGDQHFYRVVDFLTLDGGQTWKKTDLGTISVSMGGGAPSIQGDGQVLGGEMRSLFEGWLVGENSGVWTYRTVCQTHADCGEGYVCNADSSCEAMPPPPHPCADGGCGPDAGLADGSDIAVGPGPDGGYGSDAIVNPADAGGTGSSGGGCRAARVGECPLWVLLGIAALVLRARSACQRGARVRS